MNTTKLCPVTLSGAMDKQLRQLAQEVDQTIANVVREAIARELAHNGRVLDQSDIHPAWGGYRGDQSTDSSTDST